MGEDEEEIRVLEIGEHLQFWRINNKESEKMAILEAENDFKSALELMRAMGTRYDFVWWIWNVE